MSVRVEFLVVDRIRLLARRSIILALCIHVGLHLRLRPLAPAVGLGGEHALAALLAGPAVVGLAGTSEEHSSWPAMIALLT